MLSRRRFLTLPAALIQAPRERTVAGITLCWCPPGRFRMGSPPDEADRRADEQQVDVTLSRGFWMGKYEVTRAQWGQQQIGEFPMCDVSYGEAREFCASLTRRTPGWRFNLPTEAQWEYACRAGSTTAFAFGASLTPRDANIMPGAGAPTRVGSYPPNAWGIHDMHGNAFEWCRDWYHAALPGGVDPDLSTTQGTPNRDGTYSRVRRGGAWNDKALYCRCAARFRYEPARRSDHIGFRLMGEETSQVR